LGRKRQPIGFKSGVNSRKGLVPVVQNVPVVPVVDEGPKVMILPELWRKTSGVVPDLWFDAEGDFLEVQFSARVHA
jgi:hypothetical protein